MYLGAGGAVGLPGAVVLGGHEEGGQVGGCGRCPADPLPPLLHHCRPQHWAAAQLGRLRAQRAAQHK